MSFQLKVCFPDYFLEEDEIKYLLNRYLKSWTEQPLSSGTGYDPDKLIFYDGFIGTILRETEKFIKHCPELKNEKTVDSWLYQGKLYRVIHGYKVADNRCKKGYRNFFRVKYDNMITHWTKDYQLSGIRHKLNDKEKYIILEADTKDHLAFDVNKYRHISHCEEVFTENEDEVIFPMYKDCIKEYKMTIPEFIELKKKESDS